MPAPTDWFERLTGFVEADYASTRARLRVEGEWLISAVNGARLGCGRLEVVTLRSLRERRPIGPGNRTTVRCVAADARALHRRAEHAGAWFQVASQFNLLEMVAPEVTPEAGVTRYARDPTQGPACAVAAGAGTLYRNYFAPVDGKPGQTADRQINTLRGVEDWLLQHVPDLVRGIGPTPDGDGPHASRAGGGIASADPRDAAGPLPDASHNPASSPWSAPSIWTLRNGYALPIPHQLDRVNAWLLLADADAHDALRAELAIGLHHHVEVTDLPNPPPGQHRPRVSQAYCSAFPVAYSHLPARRWEPLAPLMLEAAYEATLLAAAEQAAQGGSRQVLLTRLGGGVFGNPARWIDAAILRGLRQVSRAGLDVILVSHGDIDPAHAAIARQWAAEAPDGCPGDG